MTVIKLFGELQKAEKQSDGTLIVSGVASSEAVDSAGETIRAEAMKAAIPDYMAFGAVREMHQPIAAGVALRCEVAGDGRTHIEARIVDPVTIKKVESGVLKGFSIGGKVTDRDGLDKTVITGIRLTEISLVDRPCNPEALVSLCKVGDRDKDEDEDKDKKKDRPEDEDADGDGEEDEEEEQEKKGKEKGGKAEKLEKLEAAHGEALAKILDLERRLAEAAGELAAMKKAPAPPKGAVMAVSKGEDALRGREIEADLRKRAEAFGAMTPTQQAATLVNLIHNGRRAQ